MKNIFIQLIIIFVFSIRLDVSEPQVRGQCGRPVLPPNATKHKIPNEKLRFDNKEKVTIVCPKDGYIFDKQSIECVNGRWMGKTPRCGKNIVVEATHLKIFDCESEDKKLIVSQHLNLSAEARGGYPLPPNAFHRLRAGFDTKFYANGSTCYRYEVTFDRKVQLWFLTIQLWIRTLIKTIPELRPSVNIYRTCELRRNRTEVITSKSNRTTVYHTFHYFCDLKSDADYIREQNELMDTINFEIKTNITQLLGLEAIFLGEILIDQKNRPQCGNIQEENLGLDFEEKLGNTFISCNDSFTDQNLSDNVTEYSKNGNPKHKFICNRNGEWIGIWPICVPIQTCPMADVMSGKPDSLVIEEIGNVYYLNESQWFAINQSYVRYSCLNGYDLMLDNDRRTCLNNGKWTDRVPHCKSTGISGLAITGILFAVLIVFVSIFLFVFRLYSKRVKRQLKETRNEIQEAVRKDTLFSAIDNNNEYETDFNYNNIETINVSDTNQQYLDLL